MKSTPAYQNYALRLLRSYPRAWRERYADEATAILEERPATLRTLFDLFLGMLDAYIRSDLFTERKYMLLQRVYKSQLALLGLAILSIFPWLGMQISGIGVLSVYSSAASESTKIDYYNVVKDLIGGINLTGACLLLTILIGGIILLKAALKEAIAQQQQGLFRLFTGWCLGVATLLVIVLLYFIQEKTGFPTEIIFMPFVYAFAPWIVLLLLFWVVIVGPLSLFVQASKINITTQLLRSTSLPMVLIAVAMSIMTIFMLITAVELITCLPDLSGLKRVIFFNLDVVCMLLLTGLVYISLWKSSHAKRQFALS